MIKIKLVLIFSFSLLRRQIATAAQEQPSSIVTWTNMGWQHDTILGPYRTSGVWMPKLVSWPFGSTLANSVWVPCGPPTKSPLGHPHGGHMGPYGLPVWGTDRSLLGRRWVPGVSPIWAPCGPPGQFCQGPMWAAHRGPFGPPSWGPSMARMDCPCGAQMGPWWGPDGSHVYRPNGPIVAPLANSAWAPHGPPITGS